MNELIYKTEIEPHHRKQTYGYQRGKRQGTNQESGVNICNSYIKQITNKDLQDSTGNSNQYFVKTSKGKESEKQHKRLPILGSAFREHDLPYPVQKNLH